MPQGSRLGPSSILFVVYIFKILLISFYFGLKQTSWPINCAWYKIVLTGK